MKLYWAPQTRSFSILWLLEELGVPYEREHVDIRAGAQDMPAYRAVNPMGKVPALRDGETVVTEQGAICAWLAERFPDKGLAPAAGTPERGAYLRWLFFAGSCIEPAFMQKANHWTTRKVQAAWGNYETVVDTLDGALKQGPWILGARFSAADIMIGSGVFFGFAFKLLEPRPSFAAYHERVTARPAFKRAQEIDAEGAALLKTG